MGSVRYYNQVDLIITTTPTKVTVTTGSWDNFATITPDIPATNELDRLFLHPDQFLIL